MGADGAVAYCSCFFFKQKTAYDMRMCDWSSDVCSSDLIAAGREHRWRYRLHWCRDHAWKPELATVAATRIGASNDGARLVVVDLAGGRLSKLADDAKPQVDAATSHGTLRNPV